MKRFEIWIVGNRRQILAVILSVNFILSLMLFDPKLHCGGDNAVYITLAESILRFGDGYSLIFTPGEPKPYTLYPFGYPLLLAPFSALFGCNPIVFKLLSLGFAVGSVALFYLLIMPLIGPLPGVALTLAIALNPELIPYSHWILSEMPFLFFSLLSLILFLKSENKEPKKPGRWFWLALTSIAFTAHIRSIGLMLAGAGFGYYVIHRKGKKLAYFTLGMALLFSPWMIRNHLAHDYNVSYMNKFLLKDNYFPEKGTIGITELVSRIEYNIKVYSSKHSARMILGSREKDVSGLALKAISVTVSLLVILGLVKNLILRAGILELYVFLYLGVVLIWPERWADVRFLIPAMPLLFMYLIDGTSFVIGLVPLKPLRNATIAASAMAFLVALIGVGTLIRNIPENLGMLSRYLKGDYYAGYQEPWPQFFEAADWARVNTPKASTFTVRKPSLFWLSSGRKTQKFPLTIDRDSVLTVIGKTDYVVISLMINENQLLYYHNTYKYFLIPAMEKQLNRFSLIFRSESPYTYIWKIIRPDQIEAEPSQIKTSDLESFRELFLNDAAQMKRALDYYKKRLKEKGPDFDVLIGMALLHEKIGEIEEAAKRYERAVEIKPSDINTLHLAGKMNHKLKKHEKAKIFYRKLLDINPRHIATLVNMGMIERIEEGPELAEQYYLKALAVDSTDASANNNYGNLLMLLGKPALAEKHYKMALKSSPDDRNIHRILAFLYLKNPARHEESLYHFRILAKLLPGEAEQLESKYIGPLEAELAQSAEQ